MGILPVTHPWSIFNSRLCSPIRTIFSNWSYLPFFLPPPFFSFLNQFSVLVTMFVSSFSCQAISFSDISFFCLSSLTSSRIAIPCTSKTCDPLPLLVPPPTPCCQCYLWIVTPPLLSPAQTSLPNITLEPPTTHSTPVPAHMPIFPPDLPMWWSPLACPVSKPLSYLTPTIVSHRWLTPYKISQSIFWPVLSIFAVTTVQWFFS